MLEDALVHLRVHVEVPHQHLLEFLEVETPALVVVVLVECLVEFLVGDGFAQPLEQADYVCFGDSPRIVHIEVLE